jgi:predicted nuclease with TOPRIM domain
MTPLAFVAAGLLLLAVILQAVETRQRNREMRELIAETERQVTRTREISRELEAKYEQNSARRLPN